MKLRSRGKIPILVLLVLVFCGTSFAEVPSPPAFRLVFPIEGHEPYTSPISAAIDHSPSERFYCPGAAEIDNQILAFTGEFGDTTAGGPTYVCDARAYANTGSTSFLLAGNHTEGGLLHYDGHPGYDFDFDGTIVAAARGTLLLPAKDPINGSRTTTPYCRYGTFVIDHGGGWSTWYLHGDNLQFLPNGFDRDDYCDSSPEEDLILAIDIPAGEPLATVSNIGAIGKHLHFELRFNNQVIDPYGWEWFGRDPLQDNQDGDVVRGNPILWSDADRRPEILQPELKRESKGTGYTMTVVGTQPFETGDLVSVWHKGTYNSQQDTWIGGYWKGTPDPNSRQKITEGGRLIATLRSDDLAGEDLRDLSDLAVKIKTKDGPRSLPYSLTDAPQATERQPECPLPDVEPGSWYEVYVRFLCNRGIMTGDADTNAIRPADKINRAEFIKLLVAAYFAYENLNEQKSQELLDEALDALGAPFSDVPADTWFAPYIAFAKQQGIAEGFPDGEFKPNEDLNRAEASKFLVSVLRLLDEDKKAGAERYLGLAQACDGGSGHCPSILEALPAKHTAEFGDVQRPQEWFYYFVYGVNSHDIADGYKNGDFGVSDPLLRRQVAKMVCNTFFDRRECESPS